MILEIDDWSGIEIDNWTSPKGNVYITVRQMRKGKDGKYFPQKTKSGGFSSLALRIEHWLKIAPEIINYLKVTSLDEIDIKTMMEKGDPHRCAKCGNQIETPLCIACTKDEF